MRGGHAAVDTASTFALLKKNCSMARTQGQPFEKKSWEPARGRLPVCMQSASYNHSHCYHADTTDLLLLLSNTIPPFLMICGSTIDFLNLPFGPGLGKCSVPLPDYSLAKRHKMAVGAQRWKAESGSHFITELDPDKRTTHDSQRTGQQGFKG